MIEICTGRKRQIRNQKHMRFFSGLLSFLVLVQVVSAAQVAAPFSITIENHIGDLRIGSMLEITVRLKNTSDSDLKTFSAWMNGTDVAYKYEIRDPSGKLVDEKKLGPPHGHLSSFVLKPGEEITANIPLTTKYDFTQPGQYTIQVSRGVEGGPGAGEARSNEMTVTVLPADGTPFK